MTLINTLFKLASEAPADVIPVDSLSRLSAMDLMAIFDPANKETINKLIGEFVGSAVQVGANLLLSLFVFLLGKWLLGKAITLLDIAIAKRDVDISVRSFFRSAVKIVGYIMLILTIIQILGINTTSIVAMLASAGLAIGMALSGTLQNFAGGIMVLFLKPYKVGDYITSQDKSGVVKEIKLFTTVLETPDRHTIFVPNSAISSSIIDNATFSDVRRLDWAVGITYGDSVDVVRQVVFEILKADKRVLMDPNNEAHMPLVHLVGLGDSSVNLMVRAWVKTDDYWAVYFDIYEKIYTTLPENGISFPFPQMDVHMKKCE